MIEGRPSKTAAYVSTWRALGDCLPQEVRLCSDPLGWSFSPPSTAWLEPVARRFPRATGKVLLATPLRRLLLWMQLRTRAIDDVAIDFVREGGRQIVNLGAGFDCRPVRLERQLGGARVFEVDHPATQARKRGILEAKRVPAAAELVPWDFERESLADLPARLQARGLDPNLPILTISEGVIPYLTEKAVEETVAAVRAFGSQGSRVLLHYIEHRRIASHTVFHSMAARVGEPLRFGWEPAALPAWLADRGFQLISDRGDDELARGLFSDRWADTFHGAGGRIAIARPT